MSASKFATRHTVAPFDEAAIAHDVRSDGSLLLVPSPTSGSPVVVTLADPTMSPLTWRLRVFTEGASGSTTVSVRNAALTTLATIASGGTGWVDLVWLPGSGWHPMAWGDTVTVWP